MTEEKVICKRFLLKVLTLSMIFGIFGFLLIYVGVSIPELFFLAWIGMFTSAIPTILWGISLNTLGIALILYAYTTKEGESRRLDERKNPGESAVKILLPLIVLVLLATVTFWGTFHLTAIIINAIPIYGLSPCVLAIFSAFIAGLIVIYVVKEE